MEFGKNDFKAIIGLSKMILSRSNKQDKKPDKKYIHMYQGKQVEQNNWRNTKSSKKIVL